MSCRLTRALAIASILLVLLPAVIASARDGFRDPLHTERYVGETLGAAPACTVTVVAADFDFTGGWDWTGVDRTAGAGDFTNRSPVPAALNPCQVNPSVQVHFVDDGIAVPTGGTPCLSWCYGPGEYVVNPEGGLLGPGEQIWNEIWSPPLEWPADTCPGEGALLEFDVYLHNLVREGATGLFATWAVRISTDGGFSWEPWQNHDGILHGGPGYVRVSEDVSDLLNVNFLPITHVQIALGVLEIDDPMWRGDDATPAPYFDNVVLKTFATSGPYLAVDEVDLPQDAFPALGVIDEFDPENNDVPVNSARNRAAPDLFAVQPGDSIVVTAQAIVPGSSLPLPPELVYVVDPNPLFDPYRAYPMSGSFVAQECLDEFSQPVPGRWYFDVPDDDFLYPGDVMQFYFQVADDYANTTRLPADLGGFGNFSAQTAWPLAFTMRALPSLSSLDPLEQPQLLVWRDAPVRRGERPWIVALENLGYGLGADFDIYVTRAPAEGGGNGLGGTATTVTIDGYEAIAYDSGDLDHHTLNYPDVWDASNDIDLLAAWLEAGGRHLLVTGDGLCGDLASGSVEASHFLTDWISAGVTSWNAAPLVDNQRSPQVLALAGNPVFLALPDWRQQGDCPSPRYFDAITASPSALQLAEFADPAGFGAAYPYAAALQFTDPLSGSEVLTIPASFTSLADAASKQVVSVRAMILQDYTVAAGIAPGGPPVQEPDLTLSTAVTAATGQVQCFCLPEATGRRLDDARAWGGALMPATITVTLVDGAFVPIPGYAAEDVWLETEYSNFVHTPGGSLADAATDAAGVTTFSGPVAGGGHSDIGAGERVMVMVAGAPLNGPPLDIVFNSADLDADFDVDLMDVAIFSEDLCGPYAFRSDFFWDGAINLADIALLAQGWGTGDRQSAVVQENRGVVGIYFDDGTGCLTSTLPDTSGYIQASIVLETAFETDVKAWELQLDVVGDPLSLVVDQIAGATNYLQDEQRFAVASCTPLPVIGFRVTLATIDLLIAEGEPLELYIERLDPPSVPLTEQPTFLTSAVDVYKGMMPASGDWALPQATINAPGVDGPPVNTISVQPLPPGQPFPWQLTSIPADTSGAGATIIDEMPHGYYTLTWLPLNGWQRPYPDQIDVCHDSPSSLAGLYRPAGTIVVDPEPGELAASWHLASPDTVVDGIGYAELTEMPVGGYTLTWQPLSGWTEPPPETATLAQYATLTFTGLYTQLTPEPQIQSIVDVGNDQGRHVRITWVRSLYDAPDDAVVIDGYGLYRRQDAWKNKPLTFERDAAGKLLGWDGLGTVAARYDSLYQFVAETLCDSTAEGGICWSVFFISAETPDPGLYYDSVPDSGYSVDNLVPGVPEGLLVAYVHDGNVLTWSPNTDPDVWHYRIYRGEFAGADCGAMPSEPTALAAGTSWTDPLGGGGSAWDYCYWLSAVDFAGNESAPTTWSGTATTGVGDRPRPFALHAAAPNPFNPRTKLVYDLPAAAPVSLQVFDISGRLVRTLVDGVASSAGRHEATWNGRDEAGRTLPAGVYFARLAADGKTQIQRLALVK